MSRRPPSSMGPSGSVFPVPSFRPSPPPDSKSNDFPSPLPHPYHTRSRSKSYSPAPSDDRASVSPPPRPRSPRRFDMPLPPTISFPVYYVPQYVQYEERPPPAAVPRRSHFNNPPYTRRGRGSRSSQPSQDRNAPSQGSRSRSNSNKKKGPAQPGKKSRFQKKLAKQLQRPKAPRRNERDASTKNTPMSTANRLFGKSPLATGASPRGSEATEHFALPPDFNQYGSISDLIAPLADPPQSGAVSTDSEVASPVASVASATLVAS